LKANFDVKLLTFKTFLPSPADGGGETSIALIFSLLHSIDHKKCYEVIAWFGTPVTLAMVQTHLAGTFKLLFRFKFLKKVTWLILFSH